MAIKPNSEILEQFKQCCENMRLVREAAAKERIRNNLQEPEPRPTAQTNITDNDLFKGKG